jgi:L-histidine Nalpha-methyltransferase / hercynylcysteine S-oxide synthase
MPGAAEPQIRPDGATHHSKAAMGTASTPPPNCALDIIDIRRAAVEVNLKEEIMSMFHPKHGPRQLPTLLLYNERGLQIFEDVRCCSPSSHLWSSLLLQAFQPPLHPSLLTYLISF